MTSLRVRIFFSIWLVVTVIVACSDNGPYGTDSCEGVDTSKSGPFDISGITMNVNHFKNGNSTDQPPGLDIEDRNLEIEIDSETVWLNGQAGILHYFIAPANACTLAPPYGVSNITEFNVVIVDGMGQEQDVSEFFNVVWQSDSYIGGPPVKVSEFAMMDTVVSRSYILRANEDILIEGEFTLVVSLSTSSGNKYDSSEGPFNIINNSD